jgi:hypothetical protein
MPMMSKRELNRSEPPFLKNTSPSPFYIYSHPPPLRKLKREQSPFNDRVFKRGFAPLPKTTSPSPLKERGIQGVR